MHHVHTMSATTTTINSRECTCLEITVMKYGRNWPRIFGLNAFLPREVQLFTISVVTSATRETFAGLG